MTVFNHFTDSEPVTTDTASFLGLWIHEPEDPESTVKQFIYGKDLRSFSREVQGTEQLFAGRKFSVVDFGEHQTETFSIQIEIPFGPDYFDNRQYLIDLLDSRKVIFIRDNRGRGIFGTFRSLDDSDEDFGSSMSFEVMRANRDIQRVH